MPGFHFFGWPATPPPGRVPGLAFSLPSHPAAAAACLSRCLSLADRCFRQGGHIMLSRPATPLPLLAARLPAPALLLSALRCSWQSRGHQRPCSSLGYSQVRVPACAAASCVHCPPWHTALRAFSGCPPCYSPSRAGSLNWTAKGTGWWIQGLLAEDPLHTSCRSASSWLRG
jgi:hypothetical protein